MQVHVEAPTQLCVRTVQGTLKQRQQLRKSQARGADSLAMTTAERGLANMFMLWKRKYVCDSTC